MTKPKNSLNTVSAAQKQRGANLAEFAFKPGQSGNPAGRRPGSRNKLSEEFLAALCADFMEHSAEAIARAREINPVGYLKIIAGLLPREVKVEGAEALTDEQLVARIQQLNRQLVDDLGPDWLGGEDDELGALRHH